MADNVTANSGSGGATFAADDIGGVHYPRTKLVHGADGVNAGDVSSANGLPVAQQGSWSVTATISGTPTVDTELPAAAALADNAANPTTVLVGSCLLGFDGTNWDRLYAIADGDAVNAGAKGLLALGSDGANYQALLTDSAGRMIVSVNGTVTVSVSGAVDTELPTAAALADGAANPTTPTVGAAGLMFNGTTWDRIRGDTTNGLDVDVIRLPTNTVAGSTSLPAGTNNIGDVDVASIAAGTALIGKVSAGVDVSNAYDGTTALVPKFAAVSAASSGNNTLVAAVSGKKIRVLSIAIIPTGSVSAYLRNGTAGSGIFADVTNKVPFSIAGVAGFVLPFNPVGWCETSANTDLILNLSAAIGVCGALTYVEV